MLCAAGRIDSSGRLREVSLDLAVAQFEGETTAVNRYAAAKERAGDAPWMHKVGFVERHHSGKLLLRGIFAGHYLDVDESDHVSETGAARGAIAGGLIGVLAGPPGIAVGLLLGTLAGSQAAHPTQVEAEPEAVAEQLRAVVRRSSSALVTVAPAPDVDEMLAAVSPGAESVLRRTLSSEEEAALEASLHTLPPTSTEG
jgi:uncharacterized membrane protein